MSEERVQGVETTMTPADAFAAVGDETRLQVLEALGDADRPLTFSEVLDRIEYDDPSNFDYHLDKLTGHFVRKTSRGYILRQAGARVVEAILSGVVTETPLLERTRIGQPCFLCGGQMAVSYREEVVGLYCADCGGTRDGARSPGVVGDEEASDLIGQLGLPPAGFQQRRPDEIPRAAEVWSVTQGQALARGVCPSCSAAVEDSVRVCDDHDASDGRCEACGQRFGITLYTSCTNCIRGGTSVFTSRLLSHPALMQFMLDHGVDPMAPEAFHMAGCEESIMSADPLEARFTFTADDEAITVTVGEGPKVLDVERHR